MCIEVTLCKNKLYLAYCYVPHRQSNYNDFDELDSNDPFSYVCGGNLCVFLQRKILH